MSGSRSTFGVSETDPAIDLISGVHSEFRMVLCSAREQ